MRIKRVHVKGLFGIFNHTINLRIKDRITIIHGPNGYGKTVILGLLKALFGRGYQPLRKVPYSRLEVELTDHSRIIVAQRPQKRARGVDAQLPPDLDFSLIRPGKTTARHRAPGMQSLDERSFPSFYVERYIPSLRRIAGGKWRDRETRDVLDFGDVVERYSDRLPFLPTSQRTPKWLASFRSAVDVRLVEAQRLIAKDKPAAESGTDKVSETPLVVTGYSEELAAAIRTKLQEYGALSQELDRSFPSRLLERNPKSDLKTEELRKALAKLDEKRCRLVAAGLLEEGKPLKLGAIADRHRSVLSVYVEDNDRKLSVFDEMAHKIDLMKSIISRRFQYKDLFFSKETGFLFKCKDRTTLDAAKLSSGEQHEVVLLYELLFKVRPKSLVLIDEPELSLHVGWQMDFLEDIAGIAELANLDVVLATHSPQIINKRWDLTEKLRGPLD